MLVVVVAVVLGEGDEERRHGRLALAERESTKKVLGSLEAGKLGLGGPFVLTTTDDEQAEDGGEDSTLPGGDNDGEGLEAGSVGF